MSDLRTGLVEAIASTLRRDRKARRYWLRLLEHAADAMLRFLTENVDVWTRAAQAGDLDEYFEEDEPVEEIRARWAEGEKGLTAPPPTGDHVSATAGNCSLRVASRDTGEKPDA